MSNKSSYLANQILAMVSTKARWFSLHTSDPGDGGDHEVNAPGYYRTGIVMSTPLPGGLIENTKEVITATPGAGTFGVVTHAGVWDAEKGGNYLFTVQLVYPVTTSGGVPLSFPVGGLRYREPSGAARSSSPGGLFRR